MYKLFLGYTCRATHRLCKLIPKLYLSYVGQDLGYIGDIVRYTRDTYESYMYGYVWLY